MIGTSQKLPKIRFPGKQSQSTAVPRQKWCDHPPASRWWLRPAPPRGRWTWTWSSWWWSPCSVSCQEFSEPKLFVSQHLPAQLLLTPPTLCVGAVSVVCRISTQACLIKWLLNTEVLCLEENFTLIPILPSLWSGTMALPDRSPGQIPG